MSWANGIDPKILAAVSWRDSAEVEARRRKERVVVTPEQLREIQRTTDAALARIQEKESGKNVPVSAVLVASTEKSLKVAARKHNGNLKEIGAYCTAPQKCRVCSGLGITQRKSKGNRKEIERKSDTASGANAATSDAPTHVRDYPGLDLSLKPLEESLPKEEHTGGQASEPTILNQAADIIAKALDQDTAMWRDQIAVHRSANRQLALESYVDAALELANRQANGSGIRSMPRAWAVLRQILMDADHHRQKAETKKATATAPVAGGPVTRESEIARLGLRIYNGDDAA